MMVRDLGEASGGLLAVDHDGESCDDLLRKQFGIERLPTTPDHLRQARALLQLSGAHHLVDKIKPKTIPTGVTGPDGKKEQLELRWTGQQIVAGIHPETQPYQRLIHPTQAELAERLRCCSRPCARKSERPPPCRC